jgi:hypothetical protein
MRSERWCCLMPLGARHANFREASWFGSELHRESHYRSVRVSIGNRKVKLTGGGVEPGHGAVTAHAMIRWFDREK